MKLNEEEKDDEGAGKEGERDRRRGSKRKRELACLGFKQNLFFFFHFPA